MGLPCIAVLSSIIAKSNLIKQLVTKTGVNWRKCKGKFAVDVFHLENSTNAIIHAHMLKKLVSKNRALMELKFYKKTMYTNETCFTKKFEIISNRQISAFIELWWRKCSAFIEKKKKKNPHSLAESVRNNRAAEKKH